MSFRTLQEALVRGYGRERSFRCPAHGDRQASASVNVIKGVWVCYACGAKGTVDTVIESDESQFLNEVEDILGRVARTYPEQWLDQFTYGHSSYWLSRFSPAAVDHFKLGYDHTKRANCYPMRDTAGAVLGVVYRNGPGEQPKYRYPRGVTKSQLLFNYTPDQTDSVVLVEGAMDAVAVWEAGHRAFGLYGSQLHPAQIDLLGRAVRRRVVLALDNDDTGHRSTHGYRNDEGKWVPGIGQRLEAVGFEVRCVDWADSPAKDLGDLDVTHRKEMLDPLVL